jgi:hypothetical protein
LNNVTEKSYSPPILSQFLMLLSLDLINRHAMKMYGGVKVQVHHSRLRHLMEMSGQLHAPAALLLVPIA